MTKRKTTRAIVCAICGKRLPDQNRRVYSRWTGNYYCGLSLSCKRKKGSHKRSNAD